MPDTLNILQNSTGETIAKTFEQAAESGLGRLFTLSGSSVVAIVFIIAFWLLGIALKNSKFIYIQRVNDLFGSTRHSQKFSIYQQEDSLSQYIVFTLAMLGFAFFFTLSYAFFNFNGAIYQYYEKTAVLLSFFKKTGINFCAVALFLLMHQRFLNFFSNIFDFDKNTTTLIEHSYFLAVKLLGITLLLFSFFFIYSPPLWQTPILYLGFLVGGGALILLIIYYIGNFFSEIATLFYFFLYLCTLEILPVLVLRKILIGIYKMV